MKPEKRIFRNILFCCGLAFVSFFFSCATFSDFAYITSVAAEIAGTTGLVDGNIASSISSSSKSIGKASESISPENEYYIGRAVAGTLLSRYGLCSAFPEAENYLNLICSAIVVNSGFSSLYKGYHVAFLDSDEINAFATPGGHIFVTRGFLDKVSSEDEIAAVLAHEISHIQLKHSLQAIKSNRAADAVLKSTGSALLVLSEGDDDVLDAVNFFDDSVNGIVKSLVDSGFSKSQEFAADKNALSLLSSAGYDVYAMRTMLEMLEENSNDKTGISRTHPSAKSRLKKIEKELKKYEPCGTLDFRKERFASFSVR